VDSLYFNDISVGDSYIADTYEIPFDELLEFNRLWDRLPIHLDETAALQAGHKAIIGSGQYTLCIKQYFINQMPWREAVIGSIGFDTLRFLNPVHGGDVISVQVECIEKRESKSKSDRGICKFDVIMSNQNDELILTYTDIVMIKK
jgi:acyl dehydratase